jgi:hypothetical protein
MMALNHHREGSVKHRRTTCFVLLLGTVLTLSACQQDSGTTATEGISSTTADDPWAGKTIDGVIQLKWEDLIPAGGNPETLYDKVSQHSLMTTENDDPLSQAVLAVTRTLSDRHPVVTSLNGRRVRMAGLVVPLEGDGETMTEFLLVAYYGACIHVPPPPANQIVYIKAGPLKVKATELFGSVWVTGQLRTDYSHSEVGDAGYTIEAEKVEPYE